MILTFAPVALHQFFGTIWDFVASCSDPISVTTQKKDCFISAKQHAFTRRFSAAAATIGRHMVCRQ
jgi:hypothetical protein